MKHVCRASCRNHLPSSALPSVARCSGDNQLSRHEETKTPGLLGLTFVSRSCQNYHFCASKWPAASHGASFGACKCKPCPHVPSAQFLLHAHWATAADVDLQQNFNEFWSGKAVAHLPPRLQKKKTKGSKRQAHSVKDAKEQESSRTPQTRTGQLRGPETTPTI